MPDAALEPEEDVVKQASEQIADGVAVDWDALFARVQTTEEREQLEGLRLLEDIARLAGEADPDETPLAGDALDDDEAEVQPDGSFGKWGKYRLRERVGEGSFGSVYRAVDPQLDLEVAIKILHERVDDPRTREALLVEGRMLAKVKHPNVVTVFGVEFEGSQAGLCTEFVRGETLEGVLKAEGPLDASGAVPIAQRVCEALAAVHRAGFVHRDVKARNVMREPSGRIVLMDFGTGRSARQLAAGRFDNTGTPLYMAPELLLDGQPASECSDVYSVGVLLFHLVTDRYPVEGETLEALKQRHRERRVHAVTDFEPDLAPRFVRVVNRALEPNPRDRYQSAAALLDALSRVFAARITLRTIVRRMPSVLAAAAITAVSLTAIGFVSSRTFNLALGRTDFDSDTIFGWTRLGARASFAPLFVTVVAFVAAALCGVCWRLVARLSGTARRLGARASGSLRTAARSLRLDDLTALTSWVLLLSIGAMVWAWWYFKPMMDAAVADIGSAPSQVLAPLSPAAQSYQSFYRQVFTELGIATSLAWYGLAGLAARRGRALNRISLAAGVATVVLLQGSAALPYRLIYDNKFPVVRWMGENCYIIGEADGDVQLFCPQLDPPRTRRVPRGTTALERQDRVENIYTSYSGFAAAAADVR